tara:strand:- start:2260 stop:3009 length:750 start_codon:yes stop_codon:yes gene_type:complete
MEEKTSAWSMLGRSAGIGQQDIEEIKERLGNLEKKIDMVQVELLGSIESLQRRVGNLEQSEAPNSVLDIMSPEELNDLVGTKIGVWPDKEDYVDDGEKVTTIESGFTFTKGGDELPVEEETPTIADINELQISINNVAEVVNEISPGSLVIPGEEYDASTDGPDSVTHNDCALAILDYISDNGGVANADWKKKGLVPGTYDYDDRKKVREILEQKEGITYWKRNNMWWFWYNEEEGLDAAHTRAYGSPP